MDYDKMCRALKRRGYLAKFYTTPEEAGADIASQIAAGASVGVGGIPSALPAGDAAAPPPALAPSDPPSTWASSAATRSRSR